MSSGAPRKGPICTYFIRRGEDGPIKIGRSRDVLARLDDLRSASAEPLVLLGTLPMNCERELHEKLDKYRMQGEWFEPALEVLAEVAKAHDPPQSKQEKAPYVHRTPPPRRDLASLRAGRIPGRPTVDLKSIAGSIANRVIFDALNGRWKKDSGSP